MIDELNILLTIDVDERARGRLREACPHGGLRFGPWLRSTTDTLDPEMLRDADVLLCEVPPANFDDFNRLKWIQLSSAGYSQVLDLPILERGIRVTNGLGNFDGPIAQWNIMMMLMWHRRMLDQLANQESHTWDPNALFQSDLYDATVGFLGYGGIGRETARLAKTMGLNVWALTRNGKTKPRDNTYCVEGTGDPEGILPDRVFSSNQMQEFLGGLDYLILALPHTAATTGLIGEKELRMLQPSAVLINPARAKIINEQALLRALKERWFRGVSLDVHYQYPLPPEHPLWEMPNLMMTPHISGSALSPHFQTRIFDIFTQNLDRFGKDEPLLNELTKAQLLGD